MAVTLSFQRTMIVFDERDPYGFDKGMLMSIGCDSREEADTISTLLGTPPGARPPAFRMLARKRFRALSIAGEGTDMSIDGQAIDASIGRALSEAREAVIRQDVWRVDRVMLQDFSHRFYDFHDRRTHVAFEAQTGDGEAQRDDAASVAVQPDEASPAIPVAAKGRAQDRCLPPVETDDRTARHAAIIARYHQESEQSRAEIFERNAARWLADHQAFMAAEASLRIDSTATEHARPPSANEHGPEEAGDPAWSELLPEEPQDAPRPWAGARIQCAPARHMPETSGDQVNEVEEPVEIRDRYHEMAERLTDRMDHISNLKRVHPRPTQLGGR